MITTHYLLFFFNDDSNNPPGSTNAENEGNIWIQIRNLCQYWLEAEEAL